MKAMNKALWVGLFLVAWSLTGCPRPSVLPISKMCTGDGATGGNTVRVICTGIGQDMTGAIIDAKKAAMFHVVKNNLKTTKARMNFSMVARSFYVRYNSFVKNVQHDGTYATNDDNMAQVKARITVDRAQVMSFLKDRGVINMVRVRKTIGNPTVAIKSRWTTKDTSWEARIHAAANDFLVSRKYNVVDVDSGAKKLNKVAQVVLKQQGIPGDKSARAAMLLGADVIFEVSATVETKGGDVKGEVSIKAYETTTRRLIGSSTGFGRTYPVGAQREKLTVTEAIQNTMQKVLVQVMNYWQSDVRDGNRFYIMIAGKLDAVQDMNDIMTLRIKRMRGVSSYKRTVSTKGRLILTLQSKMDQLEMSLTLKQTLRGCPGVKSLSVPLTTRKMFIIAINKSASSVYGSDKLNLP
jgi:hypothetical protein